MRDIAHSLGCTERNIVITSGGTEGNNTVIQPRIQDWAFVVTSPTEHHSVLHAANSDRGCHVLPVDALGRPVLGSLVETLRAAMRAASASSSSSQPTAKRGLVSLALVNNEVGTVTDLRAVVDIVAAFQKREAGSAWRILVHTDAVQAPGHLALDVTQLGVDFLTLSAHKFHGPKGIGVLYVREPESLRPMFFGGYQQHGLRPAVVLPFTTTAVPSGYGTHRARPERSGCTPLHKRCGSDQHVEGCALSTHGRRSVECTEPVHTAYCCRKKNNNSRISFLWAWCYPRVPRRGTTGSGHPIT